VPYKQKHTKIKLVGKSTSSAYLGG